MRPNETVFQYVVAIRELANRGQGFLDETSIMEYCINGIPDSPSNKLILYGCTTIQEFKEKLGIYDKIFQNKSKNHSYDTTRSPNFSSQRRDVESTLHKHRNDRYPKFNAPKRNSKFENKNFRDRNHPSPSSPQKDGSPRVCIDFRKLNRVLVKDHYPLPLIEDILDKLQDTRVFSTIDLRLTGYFRKFIPAYSVIAKPLSDLLRKDTPFNFDVKQKASFDELKRLLCQKPVLGIYRQNCETEIYTDASIDGLAAVLLQRFPDDNSLHPIYYMSRKTSETEKIYQLRTRSFSNHRSSQKIQSVHFRNAFQNNY
ncbi:retrovirus-related Pol polyprotein from transposon 297 [Trichonephila clavipes]|uniref:Retrovirus-related Pol polyprotein from transposon 297 n=1 Tax=Trichonephila clavipes TaxID=2585209 RepID=A0A8X7BD02_TRICX|nr:retrovirus-related Pol polyprotein from transposon 297 [Trichonephila clavipes]